MSIKEWATSPEAYWACLTLVSLAVALYCTIAGVLTTWVTVLKLMSPDDPLVSWTCGWFVLKLTTLWSIFVMLKYTTAVVAR